MNVNNTESLLFFIINQLNLEIALHGVSAPNAFGVEASNDVIDLYLKPFPNEYRA